ncbi:hypothetical protein WJX74_002112 [Apatococcus lobatus]|uniref:Anticodon-binding domain-containing protein n=1 Tax=Apatococcus lobatus TaxID=904363 RepID=A0AAW1QJ60_9CHLO
MEGQTTAATGSKKRRRAPSAPQDPAEAARRYQQRKLREEAIKARGQGQGFIPNKKRKLGAKSPSKGSFRDQPAYGKSTQPGRGPSSGGAPEEDAGSRPMTKVKVIVVPIYWNRKKEEKAQVLAAAGRVEKVIQDAGVTCGIDTTNKLTPGQKFRFWEERHVKIRVELGPKEAAAGQCVVAKCKKPGAVAAKSTVRIGPALVELVKPIVTEDAAAGDATRSGEGHQKGADGWAADLGDEQSGKCKEKSKAEQEAKKSLKKRAKQLQKQAAADQQGTTALERKALPIPMLEEDAAFEAGNSSAQPPELHVKKAKKQKATVASASALKPALQPVADINRWDADPEAADVGMTDAPAPLHLHKAPDDSAALSAANQTKAAKVASKKQKRAFKKAPPGSSASDPAPTHSRADGMAADINRWDADPEASHDTPLDLQGGSAPTSVPQEAQTVGVQPEIQQPLTANGTKHKPIISKLKPVIGVSGDDLGDEFDIAVEDEEEEDAGMKRKGKKKKAAQGAGRAASSQLPAWQSDGGSEAKRMKQVIF